MKYLLLIYSNETTDNAMSDQAKGELFQAYDEFTAALKGAGALVAGDALQSVETATTVRVRNGDITRTDGPFAETKEQLGGYYLVEAADLDDAVRWAAKIPSAANGSIEVRPIMSFE